MLTVWPSSPRARLLSSQADARVAAVIAAGKATQAKADAREAAYAKAVKAYQDQIAAREAAYIKAVLGK